MLEAVLAVRDPIDIEALNALVLELHALCHELPLRAFQTRALERVAALVAFDSALIAIGTVSFGVPDAHDAFLYRQPAEMMQSWERVKAEDTVSFIVTSSPGRAFAFEAAATYPAGSGVMAHCERYGILQLLTTAAVDVRAGSFVVISLYRADRAAVYTERDRATMELLVPHLVACMRRARLDDLRRATHVHPAHAPAAAIVNRRGIVLEAEPRFIDVLGRQYPDFRGPALPEALTFLARVTEPTRRTVGHMVLRADAVGDLVLVHARRSLPVDALTDREREVAARLASGLSMKEIADELGIAANTVRVHVTRIYAKLGVMNKAELASMLAGLE